MKRRGIKENKDREDRKERHVTMSMTGNEAGTRKITEEREEEEKELKRRERKNGKKESEEGRI